MICRHKAKCCTVYGMAKQTTMYSFRLTPMAGGMLRGLAEANGISLTACIELLIRQGTGGWNVQSGKAIKYRTGRGNDEPAAADAGAMALRGERPAVRAVRQGGKVRQQPARSVDGGAGRKAR